MGWFTLMRLNIAKKTLAFLKGVTLHWRFYPPNLIEEGRVEKLPLGRGTLN